MSSSPGQGLAFQQEADDQASGIRREPRREGLRQADYGAFPRMSLDAEKHMGLLLNESDKGLCLAASNNQPVGTLLRVMVRGLHGHISRDVVARVVWSKETSAGHFRLGLALLRESGPRMSRVRYQHGQRTRITGESFERYGSASEPRENES